MSADGFNRAPTDRTRIDAKIPWHVTYWSKELECTEAELRDLVAVVGVMVSDVREMLRWRRGGKGS